MKDPRKSALMCCEGASHPDLALVEPELVGKVDGGWIPALAPLSQIPDKPRNAFMLRRIAARNHDMYL